MLLKSGCFFLLVLVASAAETNQKLPQPRRARFSANSPSDVARCLNGALQVGCSTFACLENSTCDTDGMHEICNAFLHTAAVFNTEGKTFVKESIRCIVNGITTKVFQTIRHCSTFQKMIAEVQEECYKKLDICEVARSNPEAIGDVVQVPSHFPNRYYSTLLQSLMECEDVTKEAVRCGIMSRLGPDMTTLFQLLQTKSCLSESAPAPGSAGKDVYSSFLLPDFEIQSNLHNRNPTHLLVRKRSVNGS